ncbi:ATP-binding protein [Flavitalea sp. BT771]|uniref:ATP-binding protein n=1 Tax=Flavitalea sp. BT771 TaxID=3063329 RepID=UPI0026E4847E|nr:ATP-binding protein [Flavitalea sp. BT771]MDO6430416.1 ATP-binding protein [Flavitalea sp. BT771]MDV6219444.1 ATP-binding protein [Flavitalea sp. BT771]
MKNQEAPHPTLHPKARFWQLNTFIVVAMCCNLINFFFYIVDGMKQSAAIEIAGIFVLFVFILFNMKGMSAVPTLLSIFFVNLHAFSLSYVQGTDQGSFLYLFPFVMAMIFFLRVRKNNLVVTTFVIATGLNLLVIVLFLPHHSGAFEQITEAVAYNHRKLNIIINFLLVIVFFYVVLRLLDAKEKKNKKHIASLVQAEFEITQAKERAEKAAAAKTRFMSNMSHELRTPLNAIIGTTHLMMQDQELLQENEHVRILMDSSQHMLHLVNEVLDFNKLDEGKLELVQEPFNLSETLRQAADAITTTIQTKNIRLSLEIETLPRDKKVVGDEMRLKQVILNLLSNAVKFTEAGEVTVKAHVSHLTDGGAEVLFAVADTGIGIPAEKIDLIFDSFTQADAETTRKYGGSGLGLSICKELVRKMGGQLQVKSDPGKGSIFYFTLQLSFKQSTNIIAKEKLTGEKKLDGVRILLVDDNAVNMRIARRFLDSWGASIETAENGSVAWELFQRHTFDLLLVDLEMPQMDGKELLAQVRKVNKNIPAIAFTAAVYENMYDDLQQHGFNGYLHKPFRPDEMHHHILRHLGLN